MALTTLKLDPGFTNTDLIREKAAPTGLVRIASPIQIPYIGTEMQLIDFDGEMGVFQEDFQSSNDAEKTKNSYQGNNTSIRIYPVTLQYTLRVPKWFLTVYGENGYGMHGQSVQWTPQYGQDVLVNSIQTNPDKQSFMTNFQNATNEKLASALDYLGIFGVNPQNWGASDTARQNDYLLKNAKQNNWVRSAKAVPGNTDASSILDETTAQLQDENQDYLDQGIMTAAYMRDLRREVTTIGSPAGYAANMPNVGVNASAGNVNFAVAGTLANPNAAAGSGKVASGTKVDAVLGAFSNRFVFGVNPLSGIDIFDTGSPDGGPDLASVDQLCLRVELSVAWGFIGGSEKFRVITHTDAATGTQSATKSASK